MKIVALIISSLMLVGCNVVLNDSKNTPAAQTEKTATSKVPETLDEMTGCITDGECIIMNGACGSPFPVNGKYREAAEPILQNIQASTTCTPTPPNPPTFRAMCRNKICVAEQS